MFLDDDLDQQIQPPVPGPAPAQEQRPAQVNIPIHVEQQQIPHHRPVIGQPHVPQNVQRQVRFDNNVNVREVDRNHEFDHIGRNTRSSGIPPLNLPHIQPSLLEHRLSNYHHEARNLVDRQDQNGDNPDN